MWKGRGDSWGRDEGWKIKKLNTRRWKEVERIIKERGWRREIGKTSRRKRKLINKKKGKK